MTSFTGSSTPPPVGRENDLTSFTGSSTPAMPQKQPATPGAAYGAPRPVGRENDLTAFTSSGAPVMPQIQPATPGAAYGAPLPVGRENDLTAFTSSGAPVMPQKQPATPRAAYGAPRPVGQENDLTSFTCSGAPRPVGQENDLTAIAQGHQHPTQESTTLSNDPLPIGYKIGENKEYTITRYLGQGGFGHTYLVENGGIEHVAKECAPRGYSYRGIDMGIYPVPGLEREYWTIRNNFANEVRILNKVRSHDTCIVYLVAKFRNNDTQYYVMAYLPGGTLEKHQQHKPQFSEDELLKILENMLGALEALQNAGVLHRDIKPRNIMRTESDDNVLIDFGNACELDEISDAIPARSLLWAPPEEFAADFKATIGPHTDIFELGATIYNLITGEYFNPQELCDIYENSAGTISTSELEKIAARYLEGNRKKIMEFCDYSIGFRKALHKALSPCASERLRTAVEWLDLISEESRQLEKHKEQLRNLEASILTNPDAIANTTIEELHRLHKHVPSAALPLARCHYHLWQKEQKNGNSEEAEKHYQRYEKFLKEAAEHHVKGAVREYADHIMLKHQGNLTPNILRRCTELYTQAGETARAANCEEVGKVMNQYQDYATRYGFAGIHNFYLYKRLHHGAVALLPEGIDQAICPQLRGIAQLLSLILSGGLCLPFLWFMAWLEQKQLSRFISPAHFSKAHH